MPPPTLRGSLEPASVPMRAPSIEGMHSLHTVLPEPALQVVTGIPRLPACFTPLRFSARGPQRQRTGSSSTACCLGPGEWVRIPGTSKSMQDMVGVAMHGLLRPIDQNNMHRLRSLSPALFENVVIALSKLLKRYLKARRENISPQTMYLTIYT